MGMNAIEQERQQPVPLRTILAQITLTSDMGIPEDIPSIDLGAIGKQAETLLELSLEDPEGLERGQDVLVTPDGRVVIYNKIYVGKHTEHGQIIEYQSPITVYPRAPLLPREKRQNRFLATTIHTHGTNFLPISPTDLRCLLISEYSQAAAPLVFAITPQRKMLLFRTEKTPRYEYGHLTRFIDYYTQYLSESSVVPDLGVLPIEYQAQLQHGLLRGINSMLNLKAYSCNTTNNIAVLESA